MWFFNYINLILVLVYFLSGINGNKPNYSYHVSVADASEGNYQEKQETRYLDNTSGFYSVLEPNGCTRLVKYVSDVNGFRPDISYSCGGPVHHGEKIKLVTAVKQPILVKQPLLETKLVPQTHHLISQQQLHSVPAPAVLKTVSPQYQHQEGYNSYSAHSHSDSYNSVYGGSPPAAGYQYQVQVQNKFYPNQQKQIVHFQKQLSVPVVQQKLVHYVQQPVQKVHYVQPVQKLQYVQQPLQYVQQPVQKVHYVQPQVQKVHYVQQPQIVQYVQQPQVHLQKIHYVQKQPIIHQISTIKQVQEVDSSSSSGGGYSYPKPTTTTTTTTPEPETTTTTEKSSYGGYSYNKPSVPFEEGNKSPPNNEYLPPPTSTSTDSSRQYLPPSSTDSSKQYLPPSSADSSRQYLPPSSSGSGTEVKISSSQILHQQPQILLHQQPQIILQKHHIPVVPLKQFSAPAPPVFGQKFVIPGNHVYQQPLYEQQYVYKQQQPEVQLQQVVQQKHVQYLDDGQHQHVKGQVGLVGLSKVQHPLVFKYGYADGNSQVHHSYSGSGW